MPPDLRRAFFRSCCLPRSTGICLVAGAARARAVRICFFGSWCGVWPLLPQTPRRLLYPILPLLVACLVLQGTLFGLHSGIDCEHLPQELGFGSWMTAWRRLHAWHEAGVWSQLHLVLLERLHRAGEIDWSRAIVDASYVQAKKGAAGSARAPSTAAARASNTTS